MAKKSDLVKLLSTKHPAIPNKDVENMTNLIFEELTNELEINNRIEIRGFASFCVRKRQQVNKNSYYNVVYFRQSKGISGIINS